MSDLISRQAAIAAFKPYALYDSNRTNAEWVRRIELVLEALPSAEKHGKWIPVNERAAKCSLCGEWEYTNGKDKTGTAIIHRAIKHYCSNCGARMDGEE